MARAKSSVRAKGGQTYLTMENLESNTLLSSHFFKVILITESIQDTIKLKLPSRFVKQHGSTLSKYAYLQVPTSDITWQVEVKRRGRRVWLHNGWQDFAEYYSIKSAYFLVFRYEGESRFRAFIFDTSAVEIQYPLGGASSSHKRVTIDRPEVIEIIDEDTDDVDERPRRPRLNQSSIEITRHSASAENKVLERAKAFKSRSPCFILRMNQSYASSNKRCPFIPESFARRHFLEKENNGIYLNLGEDGRSWFVKYSILPPPRVRVRLRASGWSVFVNDNHLQVGDVCVFELVDSETMAFKVTIFRMDRHLQKMDNPQLNSLHSPHFFKFISAQTIHNGSVELPLGFVEDDGNNLSKYADLQVPIGGLTWRVEVKRNGHRVWLHKRWQDFVEYYSIKVGYFLVFRYEGESCFHVLIFDTTTLEIQYPVRAASSSRKSIELDRSKALDDDDDDDDDQRPQQLHKSTEITRHSTSAADKVLRRAKAYKSSNPYFIIKMTPYYVSNKPHLYVPQSIARSHFLGKKNIGIHLNLGEDGRSWFVNYIIEAPPKNRVRFAKSGWRKFVKENHLQVGDVCVFELVNSNTMVWKVTIFRMAEYA